MEELCLFCGKGEKGHPVTVDYVCSWCVTNLMAINGEEGKKLFKKAKEKGNVRQCQAISLVKGIR